MLAQSGRNCKQRECSIMKMGSTAVKQATGKSFVARQSLASSPSILKAGLKQLLPIPVSSFTPASKPTDKDCFLIVVNFVDYSTRTGTKPVNIRSQSFYAARPGIFRKPSYLINYPFPFSHWNPGKLFFNLRARHPYLIHLSFLLQIFHNILK